MERYSIIPQKAPREIVLLRGTGCVYRHCTFCDYHLDRCLDEEKNFALNREVLASVTGKYGNLEVINSGSVFELGERTLSLIHDVCLNKRIGVLHFESHYLYRDKIPALRERFRGIALKMKLGLETFDDALREGVLKKGIPERDPAVISKHFEEANFLFGITGQTVRSMKRDIELGLKYFERICLNLMCKNSTKISPDPSVIAAFLQEIYPLYRDDARVDILIDKTDFGVGE